MGSDATAKLVIEALGSLGVVDGKLVYSPKSVGSAETPDLKKPSVEVLIETLEVAGQTVYRASSNDRDVRVGQVTVKLKPSTYAVARTKNVATRKLAGLLSAMIQAAYLKLLESPNPETVEHARTMEAP